MATSLLEPRAPSLARQHYRGAVAARRKFVRALRLVALLALAAFAVTGWYVGKRGFGRKARLLIAEELAKRGVQAHINRLTLDPFRGLVAQDVHIFDATKQDTLAVISEIALEMNYAALLQHQPFLNALDVRGARLTIPLPPNADLPAKVRVTNLRAHVFFPPDQIYVSQADGVIAGVRISASGQLIKPANYEPPPGDEEARRRALELLQRAINEIEHCRFATAPIVQVKWSADVTHPETAHATATIRADSIVRADYQLRNASFAAEWANEILTVTRCEISDAGGTLTARGTWNASSKQAEVQLHSTLDAARLLKNFGSSKVFDELAFSTPPTLDISGSMQLTNGAPRFAAIGRIAAANFSYRKVPVTNLAADFSWDGARTMLRDVRARFEQGEITADYLDAPNDFRLTLDSTVNPSVLRPLLPADAVKVFAECQWQRPPHLRLSVRGRSPAVASWNGDGNISFEHAHFRNVPMNSLSARIRFADHAINFEDLRVTRDEGVGTGALAYDLARHELRLTNVRTTLRPADVIIWIDPRLYKHVAPYKLRQVPKITTNGVVQFEGGTADRLELLVDSPGGMDYNFLGQTLPIDRLSGRLLFTHNRLQISDLAGTLFNGTVRASVDLSLAKGDPHYRASASVEGVDFPRLTDLYFKYKTSKGRLTGSFDWTGFSDEARSIDGSGKLRVTEGNLFAIPIFGPLSSLLGTIIPGAGYSVAHEATADFKMNNGIIHTDNFKVAGKLYSMVGHGDIDSLNDRLNFDVKISAGGAGALLTPVYNLFEYKGEGSIKDPHWHPKNF